MVHIFCNDLSLEEWEAFANLGIRFVFKSSRPGSPIASVNFFEMKDGRIGKLTHGWRVGGGCLTFPGNYWEIMAIYPRPDLTICFVVRIEKFPYFDLWYLNLKNKEDPG